MIKTNSSQLFNALNKVCSTSFGYVNKPPIRKRLKYRNKSHCNSRTTGPFTVGCDYYKHSIVRGTPVASTALLPTYEECTLAPWRMYLILELDFHINIGGVHIDIPSQYIGLQRF
jgi:hypothetical protein